MNATDAWTFLTSEKIVLDEGLVLDSPQHDGAYTGNWSKMTAISNALIEHKANVKRVISDGSKFSLESWSVLKSSLAVPENVERLELSDFKVGDAFWGGSFETDFLSKDGLLDDMLRHNEGLKSLKLENVGSCMSIRGATELYLHLAVWCNYL